MPKKYEFSDDEAIKEIEKSITDCLRDNQLNKLAKPWAIGPQISKAKSLLVHGSFKQWIRDKWGGDLPYSTAGYLQKNRRK